MDAINRNQVEENRKNLQGGEAIAKIREIVGKAENCFFCTMASFTLAESARPMNVRKMDEQGNLWFLSANDSMKIQELASEPHVRLFFQGSAHSDFMVLNGRATVSKDLARIHDLWSPV